MTFVKHSQKQESSLSTNTAIDSDALPSASTIQHQHSSNRNDFGCGGAGIDRVDVANGLRDGIWTIKELIENAAG